MSYTSFGTKLVNLENIEEITRAYHEGYVFTRTEKGRMERVRSLRVNLKEFEESSENRRVLRKFSHLVEINPVPFPDYSWQIHKLGKDFYETKFGPNIFSANKIKELFTEGTNFNTVLTFKNVDKQLLITNYKLLEHPPFLPQGGDSLADGYCICYTNALSEIRDSRHALHVTRNPKFLHYAYPFYNLNFINSSFGIYMMTKTLQFFKEKGFDYIYLGSVHERASLYKLQFKGTEWWDEEAEEWKNDLEELKRRVSN